MIYRQFINVRRTVLWFLAATAAIAVLGVAIAASQGHVHGSTPLQELALTVAWPVAVLAAILGMGLGNTSRGPARVVWVLPIARWKLALQLLAVDATALTVALVVVFGIGVLFFLSFGLFGPWSIQGHIDAGTAFAVLSFLFAVYGWSAIVAMFLRRVAFRAISFPLLLIWMMFGQVGGVFGTIIRAPIALNPFAVLPNVPIAGSSVGASPLAQSLAWMAGGWEIPMLLGTALIFCGATVALWQRAEVLPA